jgi:hypothetical protein
MVRIVHIVDQFFAGIGGEDRGDVAVGASEDAAGRALGFALTAYPTFGMLATVTIVLAFRLVR